MRPKLITLTLEDGNKISIRPDLIRTVQDCSSNRFTSVTLDSEEVYIVQENRMQVTAMIEQPKRTHNGKH